jgi:hypothetical protein
MLGRRRWGWSSGDCFAECVVTRTVREAALVHGRWLRMTITRVLPRLHFGLLGLRPGGK